MKRFGAALLVSLFFLGFQAEGEDTKPTETRDPVAPAESRASERPDVRVTILSDQNRSVEGLGAEILEAGALKIDLAGRFSHALVLRVSPEGRSIECVDHADLLEEILRAAQDEPSTETSGSTEE